MAVLAVVVLTGRLLHCGAPCSCVFFFMQTVQRCKLSFRTSLHSLVQVTSFIGAERVEGGDNKLPIEGAARQQPLSLFGVTGVGILYKHLVDTQWI